MAEFSLEEIIKEGIEQALKEPIADGKSVTEWAAIGMTAPRWISVKDRLPEIGTLALVFGSAGAMTVARYIAGAEWVVPGMFSAITHWMPLPAPPKE